MGLCVQEKDKLVAEVIRYVLFKTHQNAGCPIKREELTQIVTKNYRHRSLPGLVINEATQKLSSVFGYELRELQRSRPSSANHGRSSSQQSLNLFLFLLLLFLIMNIFFFLYPSTRHHHIRTPVSPEGNMCMVDNILAEMNSLIIHHQTSPLNILVVYCVYLHC